MSEPLSRASTAMRVAEVLRERIVAGEVAPGERLVELEISRELGVSRSPIREALLRLAEEGLVTIVPYRGALVASLSRQRLQDLLEVRLALERYALSRLIARADEAAHATLLAHVETIERAVRARNARAAVDADMETHRAMIALAGNDVLLRSYDALLNQFRTYIRITSGHYERAEDLADEHRALLAALRERDATYAQAILDAHITHGLEEALDAAAPE